MADRPYHGPRRKGSYHEYTFVSVRMPDEFKARLEALAVRENIAINSLINALLDLALDAEDTPEGQQEIHAACALWRTRWETKVTSRRKARLPQ